MKSYAEDEDLLLEEPEPAVEDDLVLMDIQPDHDGPAAYMSARKKLERLLERKRLRKLLEEFTSDTLH
jgi:hypothetical protein